MFQAGSGMRGTTSGQPGKARHGGQFQTLRPLLLHSKGYLVHGILRDEGDEPKPTGPLVVVIVHDNSILHLAEALKVSPEDNLVH